MSIIQKEREKMAAIIGVVLVILGIIADWKIFEKAGVAGWMSIIPFVNLYQLFKIAWGNGWLFLLELIPIVNIVVLILLYVKLARAFEQPGVFAVGLIFLPSIFLMILGFGSSRYIGPNGQRVERISGDSHIIIE